MQGIEFEEEKDFQELRTQAFETESQKNSFMVNFLEKAGVNDKTTANFILLGITAIFFGITIFLYAGILGDNLPSKQEADQIAKQIKAMQQVKNFR